MRKTVVAWTSLVSNGLWVLGTAVILASFSLSYYEAHRRGERLRVRLAAPGFHLWLSVGLMFISLGLTLLEPRWWVRVLWGVLFVTNAGQLWSTWRARRTRGN